MSNRKVVAYTDGACSGNPGPGGYGVVLVQSEGEKELSEGFRLTSNNRMEIWAAIAALKALNTKCVVTIYSDSQYLVNTMSQGWQMKANTDLWEQLLILRGRHEVKFVYVKGHGGNPGNERANQLAQEALNRETLGVDTIYEQMNPPTLF